MDWWEVVWATGAKIHLSPTLGKSLKDSLEGFPGGSDGKEFACSAGDLGSIPKSGGSPGDPPVGCMATTPVFLPGESYGQSSLAGSMGSQRATTTSISGSTSPVFFIGLLRGSNK